MNVYINLTNQFNIGRTRAILSSGQAVVFHRLAIMSKDGDWIVREDDEALNYILHVLDRAGARYRFGAPLDKRWLAGGWSSHFEFSESSLRIRTDFVSRPPRINSVRLAAMWEYASANNPPVVGLEDLAELKKTNREKDYAIIGELSRKMASLESRVRYSRSAREMTGVFTNNPDLVIRLMQERGIVPDSLKTIDTLEAALDIERRKLIHANERRLSRYLEAAQEWSKRWKEVERTMHGLPLLQAHEQISRQAATVLPFTVPGEAVND
jgi:hypothetical protein